jgi:short subunit dehydrogenase-like uncharacterized protein
MTEANSTWMLYGATGYTGQLLAEYAVSVGERPLLAGRNEKALRILGERLNLPWLQVSLDDAQKLRQGLGRVKAVLHAAGPFVETYKPMIEACFDTRVHYLDITGEWPVFEALYARHGDAVKRGICLLPGVGFDVVPSDCLAMHVAQNCPNAVELKLAVAAIGQPSLGTTLSALKVAHQGGFAFENGQPRGIPLGRQTETFRFQHGPRRTVASPLSDMWAIHRATEIPNISAYLALPERMISRMRLLWPVMNVLRVGLRSEWVQGQLRARLLGKVHGPDAQRRQQGRSFLFAEARNNKGQVAHAWLETMEGYSLTARTGVDAVRKVLESRPGGALTPSQLLGKDYILSLPNTERVDALPGAIRTL